MASLTAASVPQIADSRSGANLDRGEQPATAAELLAAAKDLYRRRQLPLALRVVDQALAREPSNVEAWNAKGVFLRDLGQTTKSIACYQQALKLNHASGEIWSNLGNSLKDLKQLDRAVVAHHQAVKLRPDNALAWHNLGITLVAANRVDEALTAFNRALLIRPGDAHMRWDRGLTLLQRGDLAAGWVDYEARFENGLLPNRPFPGQRWALQPYRNQRLLVTAEQGFGDTIWAARFLERTKALGGQLILECQKELKPLLEPLGFVDEFINKGAPLPATDWHSSICSLPGLFTPSLAQVSGLPYLAAKSGGMDHLRPLLARAEGRLRVGIVWSGSTTFKANADRAVSMAPFIRAFAMPGVQLFSLQKGPPAAEIGRNPGAPIIDLAPLLGDFADTAAAIEAMDLIIMTDSAVAHLAGAMGKPVWLLLPFASYWVWPRGNDRTPWYQSIRLIRQARVGDWSSVFSRTSTDLARLVAANAGNRPQSTTATATP